MTNSLNVGVIGVGGIAQTHMPGWAASEHAAVIAGCDLNPDALAAWGQKAPSGLVAFGRGRSFRQP